MPPSQLSPHKPGSGSDTASSMTFAVRPPLPDRNVTTKTIEDAYVDFILYCNPSLPLTADIEALREAFRNPPRSGGKVFSPFTIYELVKKFYDKEIKTWTELTTTLGVEPPDPSKDESAQKIAQYGVRLKKWMNSMHVKSFFEYLMNIPNDYWKQLPIGFEPTSEPIRDGVAVEDDMALRALLPHIRPKRGRKRPDGEDANLSAQRQRLSPSSAILSAIPASAIDEFQQGSSGMWSSQGDLTVNFPLDPARPNTSSWNTSDAVQTPLVRWPHSAITPSTRGTFWDEPPEPRSAITASKPRLTTQRRGAKNVSSAWKPGGPDSTAKTRGRPPMNRTPVETPTFSHPSWISTPTQELNPAGSIKPAGLISPVAAASINAHSRPARSPTHPILGRTTSAPVGGVGRHPGPQDGRPARPSISLQVPERQGGSVRLATPPPLVVVNGGEHPACTADSTGIDQARGWNGVAEEATDAFGGSSQGQEDGFSTSGTVEDCHFERMEDRTNVDALMGFFTQTTYNGEWVDAAGNPAEQASTEECMAIVNMIIHGMSKRAGTVQAFLLNLAALAGAQVLMTRPCRCSRLGEDEDSYQYSFNWEYRFGSFKGAFNLSQHVPRTMWTRPLPEGAGEEEEAEELSAADWQRRYMELKGEMVKRNRELAELRGKVISSLREDGKKQ